MELADSITGDAHKLLNVPYDCGFFFCRDASIAPLVFQNPNAAYLGSTTPDSGSLISPSNIGIENSRRFRGLPVYASLMSYGRSGYGDMLERQVQLARAVAEYVHASDAFHLLPDASGSVNVAENIFIIVLFRAKDAGLNTELVGRINASSKIYVSGTRWDCQPASRMAISNWQANAERDLAIIKQVLESVVHAWQDEAGGN